MWFFRRNESNRRSKGIDQLPRKDWAEQVKKLVENAASSTYPGCTGKVSMIGIELPADVASAWKGASAFVQGLEEHGKFDKICFRVFVGIHNAKSGEFQFAKHIEVKAGKPGNFFWPPRQDWASTPIIYAHGQHLSKVTTPGDVPWFGQAKQQGPLLPISRLQAIIVAFHNFPSEIVSDDQGTNLALTYFKYANPDPEFMRLIQKLPHGKGFDIYSLNVSGCSVDEFPVNATRAVVKDFSSSSLFAQGFRRIDPHFIDTFVFTVFEPGEAEESRKTVITDGTPIIPVWQ